MEIQILYQDESLVVVNKPNNMLVHPSYYARNIKTLTLVEALQDQLKQKVYPVHRLDHKTSGLLVFGFNSEIANGLQNQFTANTIQKSYLALLRGYVDAEGVIDTPVQNADTKKYKEALTVYNCLEKVEVDIAVQPYVKSRYSVVLFQPKTGRMHQLRKHANKISHPIIGDHKYGNRHHNRMFTENLGFENLFLHAYKLKFEHPLTHKEIEIKCVPPLFWKAAFKQLGINLTF